MKKRDQKKKAQKAGVSPEEMALVELLEEMLERFAMLEVLSYANNFLITERTQISPAERERVFRAALRAVEPETRVEEWRERLGRIKGEVLAKKRAIRRFQKQERMEKAPPLPDGFEEDASG